MKLSIVIPCYNEKDHLLELISRVKSAPVPDKEIILVDDYSTDGTRELIKTRIETTVDRVIYQPMNRGKGAAIRSGLDWVTADLVISAHFRASKMDTLPSKAMLFSL